MPNTFLRNKKDASARDLHLRLEHILMHLRTKAEHGRGQRIAPENKSRGQRIASRNTFQLN
jgi:hypothetical protein